MKLLILTQKVDENDDILGFFHGWIKEFAALASLVTVICLQKGRYDLPENVRVISLGKEKGGKGFLSRFIYVLNFYRHIWKERKNYDVVFVHMNPEYVVLGGIVWRLMGKKIGFWYTHKQTSFLLMIAEKMAHVIWSATKESFRLGTRKVNYVGHGIDTEVYKNISPLPKDFDPFSILHVGRITPIKNCDTLIRALKILSDSWERPCKVVFAGEPGSPKDQVYLDSLRMLIKDLGLSESVEFLGKISHREIASVYSKAHVTVNLTPTGGMDKVVLESVAAGIPVFTSNNAFAELFDRYADKFIFSEKDAESLASKIKNFAENYDALAVEFLRGRVIRDFGAKKLIGKIIEKFEKFDKL